MIITLPQSECFCKESQVTCDYRGNRAVESAHGFSSRLSGLFLRELRGSGSLRDRTEKRFTGKIAKEGREERKEDEEPLIGGVPRFLVHLTP
jgi:hypothetical protein